MSSPFSAAGPIQGALFQVRYALWLFVRSALEDPTVSMRIEGLDDIEIVRDRGSQLIQSKHHGTTASATPQVTDRSTDLWKTLRVWATLAHDDPELLEGAIFTLVTTATCSSSSNVSLLTQRSAPTLAEARKISRALTSIANAGGSKVNEPGYAAYLQLTPANRERLIRRITIIDESYHNIQVEAMLENLLRGAVTGGPQLTALVHRLEGWWQSRVAVNLQDEHDLITGSEFFQQLRSIADSLGPEALPADDEALSYKASGPIDEGLMYVRQLRLLGCGNRIVLRAVTDFTRAQRQIAEWMREELLFVNELTRYRRKLIGEWELRFDMLVDALMGVSDGNLLSTQGRNLYEKIIELSLPIRKDWPDNTIMRGTYHALADIPEVGWHPKFKELL